MLTEIQCARHGGRVALNIHMREPKIFFPPPKPQASLRGDGSEAKSIHLSSDSTDTSALCSLTGSESVNSRYYIVQWDTCLVPFNRSNPRKAISQGCDRLPGLNSLGSEHTHFHCRVAVKGFPLF